MDADTEPILFSDRLKINGTGDFLTEQEKKAFRAGLYRGYTIRQIEEKNAKK